MINYWVNQRIRELGVEFRYSFENSFVNFFKNTISCFRKCVSLNVTQLFGGEYEKLLVIYSSMQ